MTLSDRDRETIRAAVERAEGRTSGEIVPVIAAESDHYWHADLIAGLAGQFLAMLAAAVAGLHSVPLTMTLVVPLGFLAGVIVVRRVPAWRRVLIGRATADEEVYQAALQSFFEEGLTETRDRTGVLIYVSLLERRVRVIADAGIHQKVSDGTWDQVVRLVLDGVRAGRLAEGVAAAIDRCGDLLAAEFPRKADDNNELPDDVRVR